MEFSIMCDCSEMCFVHGQSLNRPIETVFSRKLLWLSIFEGAIEPGMRVQFNGYVI